MGQTQSTTRTSTNSMASTQVPNRSTLASSTAQQLRDFVKNQVKAESLRRAGNQGADPWGDMDELIPSRAQLLQSGISAPFNRNNGLPGFGSAVAGQEPEEREPLLNSELPAFLTQPLTLLNRNSANGNGNGDGNGNGETGNQDGQQLNYEIVYYAPVYESTSTREVINCCEDCCEDVCENCCLNCCLDCSRLTEILKPKQWNDNKSKNGNQATADPLITTADSFSPNTTTIGNIVL